MRRAKPAINSLRKCDHGNPLIDIPPSGQIICPVMYDAAGKQRNVTSDETSLGSPGRPIGIRGTKLFANSGLSADA